MQTPTKVSRYQHRSAPREERVCRNLNCSRIQREIRNALTGASEVHHALCVPESQRIGHFDVAARIVPARHIGGDFVCKVDAGPKTVLLLGDLMGKGLSAAMWITHIIDLAHRAAEQTTSLSEVISRLNHELIRSRVRAPLTSAVGVAFERGSDEVSCTLAGHPPAVVLRGDATTELLTTGGPLLGVFPNARYDSTTVKFSSNDALVAFSDGVTESETDSAEEFSLQRVTLTLANHARVGALQKVNALLEAARVFSAEGLKDDASALVIQRS